MKRSGFKQKTRPPRTSLSPSGPTIRGYTAPAEPVHSTTAPRETGEVLDKPVRLRSRAYLDMVKDNPCEMLECIRQAEDPHHVKVRGNREDDFDLTAIPLCRRHHDDAHDGYIPKEELHRMLGAFLCRKLPLLTKAQARRALEQMLAGL